jgi:4-amino-4-deoxy-L-arabinose transferase-like glycosyltransferase
MRAAPASPWVQALLLAGALLLLCTRLDATGLWAPDEPRYGLVAETLRSMEFGPRGLVLLHLNGQPYTQKPPLYFWLAAAAGMPLGHVGEAAARVPSALAGIALVGVTLAFGTRLLGGAAATLGAALLLTTFEFAHNARRAQLDVLLALFETLALAAFWRVDRGIGGRRVAQIGMHAALGLAVLTKGPVGFLVPLFVIACFLAWERRLRDLPRALPWWGLVLSIGPGLAWIASAVAFAPPGFFGEAVIENLIGRFFSGTAHARPFYYYAWQFPVETLPWILLVPAVPWAARTRIFRADADDEDRRAWRFLLAWVGATLLFFSLSSGKRGLYLLPLLPATSLLLSDALVRWVESSRRIPPAFHAVTGAIGAALAGAGAWLALRDPLRDSGASLMAGAGVIVIVGIATLAQIGLARARARLRARLAVPVVAAWVILMVIFQVVYPARDSDKSPRPIARAAASLTAPGRAIGLVGDAQMAGGLAYYGGRRVDVLDGPHDVARFIAAGGRAIVVAEKKRERVDRVMPTRVHFRAREGRRAVLVLEPDLGPDG